MVVMFSSAMYPDFINVTHSPDIRTLQTLATPLDRKQSHYAPMLCLRKFHKYLHSDLFQTFYLLWKSWLPSSFAGIVRPSVAVAQNIMRKRLKMDSKVVSEDANWTRRIAVWYQSWVCLLRSLNWKKVWNVSFIIFCIYVLFVTMLRMSS